MGIIGAAVTIVGAILLGRSHKSIIVAGKDKARLNEIPHSFSIFRFSATLLAGLGLIALVAGMMSFSGPDPSGKIDWRGGLDCFVVGGILLLPAVFVTRRDKSYK